MGAAADAQAWEAAVALLDAMRQARGDYGMGWWVKAKCGLEDSVPYQLNKQDFKRNLYFHFVLSAHSVRWSQGGANFFSHAQVSKLESY